ncbi:hypothetical protein [Pseudidiomarina taiwanensis]|uniref:Inovirus Gp2 family protein n=1 Tax=Pseudidiomarina taiwanensis TaxID=337250 RepID=A0A432ZEQ8_9GAMM|nr:hypothetical protein [Pseudidiomarina taiwanensis]RUO76446.1 hypothetical protein CWI83_08785 [Pseudidiomarina taiwanensis]
MNIDTVNLKTEVFNWLNESLTAHQQDLVAVTLTFKQGIKISESAGAAFVRLDREKAEQNLRHFLNILNQRILGKRFRRFNHRLISVPVFEHDELTRFHAHLILEKPQHLSLDEFTVLIQEYWTSTQFGYRNIDVRAINDSGWISYLLKNRTKTDGVLDAIDLSNCHLPNRRLEQTTCR